MSLLSKLAEKVAISEEIPISLAKRKIINSIIILTISILLAAFIYLANYLGVITIPDILAYLLIAFCLICGFIFSYPIIQAVALSPVEEEDFTYLIVTAYATKLSSSREIIRRFVYSFGRIFKIMPKILVSKPPVHIESLLTLIDIEGSTPSTIEKALSKFETILEKRILEFKGFMELINSIVVGLYVTFPILSLVLYFISGSGLGFTILIAIILTFFIILTTVTRVPRYFPKVIPYLPSIAIVFAGIAIALILMNIFHQTPWLTLGVCLSISSIIGYLIKRDEAKIVDEILSTLPRVLTTLYDRVKEVKSINVIKALGDALRTAPTSVKKLFNPFLDNVNIDIASKFKDYLPIAVVLRSLLDFSELGVNELAYKVLADGLSKIYDAYETYKSATLSAWLTLCLIMPFVLAIAFSLIAYTSKIFTIPTTYGYGVGIGGIGLTFTTLPPIDYLMTCGLILVALAGFTGGFIRWSRLAEALLWLGIATGLYTLSVEILVKSGIIEQLISTFIGFGGI